VREQCRTGSSRQEVSSTTSTRQPPRKRGHHGRLPGADLLGTTMPVQLGHLLEAGGELFHDPENPGTGAGSSHAHATRDGFRHSLHPAAKAPCAEDLPDLPRFGYPFHCQPMTRSAAFAASKVWTKLVPPIGSWSIPSTFVRLGEPDQLKDHGGDVDASVNCARICCWPGSVRARTRPSGRGRRPSGWPSACPTKRISATIARSVYAPPKRQRQVT